MKILHDSNLSRDIITHFEACVSKMSLTEKRQKREVLFGLSACQMLRNLKSNSELGQRWIKSIVDGAYQKVMGGASATKIADNKPAPEEIIWN